MSSYFSDVQRAHRTPFFCYFLSTLFDLLVGKLSALVTSSYFAGCLQLKMLTTIWLFSYSPISLSPSPTHLRTTRGNNAGLFNSPTLSKPFGPNKELNNSDY